MRRRCAGVRPPLAGSANCLRLARQCLHHKHVGNEATWLLALVNYCTICKRGGVIRLPFFENGAADAHALSDRTNVFFTSFSCPFRSALRKNGRGMTHRQTARGLDAADWPRTCSPAARSGVVCPKGCQGRKGEEYASVTCHLLLPVWEISPAFP